MSVSTVIHRAVELLETFAHEMGTTVEDLLVTINEVVESKKIAEQNSEGDHVKEAIDYIRKH